MLKHGAVPVLEHCESEPQVVCKLSRVKYGVGKWCVCADNFCIVIVSYWVSHSLCFMLTRNKQKKLFYVQNELISNVMAATGL